MVPEVTNQSVGNRSKKASKEAQVEAGRKSNLVVAASFGGAWRRVLRRMVAILVALESRRQDEQDGYEGTIYKRANESAPAKRSRVNSTSKTTRRSSKIRFKPTYDMDLNRADTLLFNFLFSDGHLPNETMVRMHQYGLTLRDIQSLIPGRPIDGKVVEMVAVRNACSIQHLKHPLFWCLPPSFADDIMKDVGTQELADCYVPFWIKPSRFISHIFIPIEDIFMHWYCMVVDFGDMTVYHLDSYPDPNMVHDREQLIRKIMGKLHEIMTSETYGHLRRYIPGDLADWPVRRGQGVPNCNTSDSPSSWVISWLNSNGKFNASNISGVALSTPWPAPLGSGLDNGKGVPLSETATQKEFIGDTSVGIMVK
ncbi:Ulp1 protease family, carboxy-terminal domain protein [Arachis hypogaea]|nr:Ulp1 protease family, carboxy-terminal domain protein [Arachis hypogaea]